MSTKVYTCLTLLLVPIRQPPPCRPMSALYRGYNFFATGRYHIWQKKKNFFPSHHKFLSKRFIYLRDNLKDQFIPKSSSNLHPQSALVKFKNGKENLKLYNYLSTIENRDRRKLLAELRLAVLPLEIKKGMLSDLDTSLTFCNCNENEDEPHFLVELPFLLVKKIPILDLHYI